MSSTSKIITAIVVVAVILIGVGYAGINAVTLQIESTLAATATQGNFKVDFASASPNTGSVVAEITGERKATLNVSGLTQKGDTATATFTIKNSSEDLSANLTAGATNGTTGYFKVTTNLSTATIAKTESSTLTVTVELLKTPVEADVSDKIDITIDASPVQPQ